MEYYKYLYSASYGTSCFLCSLGKSTPPSQSQLQLPVYEDGRLDAEKGKSSSVIDSRDQKLQRPYQGWLLNEILVNAQAGINIHQDRTLVRSPKQLFCVRTLEGGYSW